MSLTLNRSCFSSICHCLQSFFLRYAISLFCYLLLKQSQAFLFFFFYSFLITRWSTNKKKWHEDWWSSFADDDAKLLCQSGRKQENDVCREEVWFFKSKGNFYVNRSAMFGQAIERCMSIDEVFKRKNVPFFFFFRR